MLPGRASELAALNEIALIIAGGGAPAWLPKMLRDWKDGPLVVGRMIAAIEPTPTEFRSRIDKVREAADLIIHEMHSPTMRPFLDSPSQGVVSNELVGVALLDFARRFENAGKLGAVTDGAGRTKKGRGRVRTPGRLPPETICAVIIAETWRYFRGEAPRPGSLKAADAAEKLWRLAGGAGHSAGVEPLTFWKARFLGVSKDAPGSWDREALTEARAEIHDRLRKWDRGEIDVAG
jgi:hypothetical protein